jgi:FkbM family methyltransferase
MIARKLSRYLRAAVAVRSLNLAGLPGLPKQLSARIPSNRESYNEFLCWIERLALSDAKLVIDAGANHGDFALACSRRFPDSRVLLFEPVAELVEGLLRKTRRAGLPWQVEPVALGREAGTAVLSIDPGNDAIGSLAGFSAEYLELNPGARTARSVTCRVTTLDIVSDAMGSPEVDLLKIDVEGYEREVLEGGRRTLDRTRAAIVEVSLLRRPEWTRHPLVETLDLLLAAGLRVVAVVPALYSRRAPWQPVEWNVLARR